MAALLMNMAVELLRSEEHPTLDERISRNIMYVYEALLHVNEDVEGRQVRDPDVKNRLESIKDLCYDVVNMLEGLKIQKAKTVHFLNHPASLVNSVPQRGLCKLMDVLDKLKTLLSDSDKLGLKTSLNQLTPDRRMLLESQRAAAPISTPNLRGRDLESSTLVDKLLSKDGQIQGHIRCISVVGGAGIGKTELARLVYNDEVVNTQFQLKAWVYVSKEFNMSKIALFLLRSLTLTSNTIHDQFGLESLFQRIVEIIRGNKCLFVLDDVRSENGYNWEQLRSLLSHGAPGSTYLITTRKKAVAQAAGSRKTDFLPLSCLSERDCWSIAMERASITADSEAEKFFSEFSAVIEHKCLGLPLNAKSLGDSLRGTSTSSGTVEGWRELIEYYVPEAIDSDEEEEEWGLHSGSTQSEWEKRAKQPTTSLVLKAAIHGREDELSNLIAKLCCNDDQVQLIQTISVVGIAGIGKTALAQLVYNSDEVNNHFKLKSWVYVSQPFNLQYIARALLECFTSDPIHGLELDRLFWRIRNFIRGKRYLFVLDHVWSQDYHKWEQLKSYLDCGALGSTLLITTRKMDVARAAGSKQMDIILLQNLEEQHCWSIIKDELSIFSDPEKVFQRYCNYITLKSQGVPHIAKNLCFNLGRAPPFSKEWQLLERDPSAAPTGFQNPTMEDELDYDLRYQEEREDERASQPTTSLVRATTIHGRDKVTGSLIQKLLSNDGQAEHIQFISIVGGAGIGKTAVAQLVYNTPEVVNSFNSRAWVFVGEEFNLKQIIKSIIESLTAKPSNETELVALLLTFRQTVDQRRCLFVLDIWLEDDVQWEELKHLLNFTNPGSRILITTRNKSIAEKICSETNIVSLDPLSESDCWSIIKDYAFGHSVNETKAQEFFNKVGKDIVQKCKGVPLMAKSLGNILRGKNSIQEWQEVLASETWDSADLMSSVMLSYLSMPPELRQFLLYCSIFPKNHSIDVGKLIKLWMAQGFIASNENEMEREGWKYIKQLLDRNIFQEFGPDSHGCFKCKLESGMSDLIHFLAKNESLRVLIDYMKDARVTDDPKICRHCTLIIAAQSSLPESIHNAKKLHTLMILSEYCFADPATLAKVLSHLKVIRALDLSSCLIKQLPSNIGELSLLRYLDLSFNRDLKKLPEAICSLLHLQTLNLNGCDRIRKLPKGIGNLINLRHLEILWMTSLSYLPKGVANLTSLRTLSRFIGSSVAGRKACNLADLKELNLIHGSITIDGLGGQTCASEASKACLKDKKHLLGLELCFSSVGSKTNDNEGVLNALEAPPELQCLEIFFYRGQSLPDWIKTLRNLRHLILAHWSECNILPSLGHLPSLESLEIKYMPKLKIVGSEFLRLPPENAVSCHQVSSSTAAFPKLQKLCFEVLNGWEDWSGDGSHANIMPSLSALSIENCPNLRTLPQYILEKKDLKRDIKNCPFLEVSN